MAARRSLVLIGAGSAVFTRGLLADLISAEDLGGWEIRLVDVNQAALDVAVGLAGRMVEARRAGAIGYTVRVVPHNPLLVTSAEMGLAALPSGLASPPSA